MATHVLADVPQSLKNTTAAWANSAAVNTEVTIDLPAPSSVARQVGAGLLIVVRNPSAVSDLAGEVRVKYDDGGTTRYAKLTTFTALKSNADGQAFIVNSGLLADGVQISLKNATVLGGADGFTARVAVYVF